jgi:hypothetical protein
MNFRGGWLANTPYSTNDAVTYGSPTSTYIATGPSNTSVTPDINSGSWSLLAPAGGAGPTGAQGAAATMSFGPVTTGLPGTNASVTNSGSSTAAILNFTIPQGAAGQNGTGGSGSTSGIPGAAVYHEEPSGGSTGSPVYYSVTSPTTSSTESATVLTWVPAECTVTSLNVYSQLTAQTTLTLRALETPASLATTLLTCTIAEGPASTPCSVSGGIQVKAGYFIDYSILIANGPTSPTIWTALTCN